VTQVPLLILSDAITSSTGLARIARDLSTRIHAHLQDTFRVGVLGVGGSISTSSVFPFPNYSIRQLEQMCPIDLPLVWSDFAGHIGDNRQLDSPDDLLYRTGQRRQGILLTIWNASWCQWLAQPQLLPDQHPVRDFLLQRPQSIPPATWASCTPSLRASLAQRPFQRWLYCPVDGHCSDGTLGWQMAPILEGFDRVLAYTSYGAKVIEDTIDKWGDPLSTRRIDFPIPHLPHGLDAATFRPCDRALARATLVSRLSNGEKSLPLKPDQLLLCAVATNTSRKDWGLAFRVCEALLARGRNPFLWGHTDTLLAHWNIPALAKQYGMDKRVLITSDRLSDDDMAECYAACDVMLGIGAGEGWGYPLSEGVGCQLPVLHGRYAGGAEFLRPGNLITPIGYSLESPYLIQRPVYDEGHWADAVEAALICLEDDKAWAAGKAKELDWQQVWPQWQQWLQDGVVAGAGATAKEGAR